jgi:hypothetical protein
MQSCVSSAQSASATVAERGSRGIHAVKQLQLQVHMVVGTSSGSTGIDAHVVPGYPGTRAVTRLPLTRAVSQQPKFPGTMSSRIRPLPPKLQLGAFIGAWARQEIRRLATELYTGALVVAGARLEHCARKDPTVRLSAGSRCNSVSTGARKMPAVLSSCFALVASSQGSGCSPTI